MRFFTLWAFLLLSACATDQQPAVSEPDNLSPSPSNDSASLTPDQNSPPLSGPALTTAPIKKAEVSNDRRIFNTQNRPIPQINGGGHTSLIRDIAFTRDGRYLVSAGEDKLIRIWDIAQAKTVRTIRGQIGDGQEGQIYAMALSPDNRYLAVGGRTHKECAGRCGEIRLYDFQTGILLSLLKGHKNAVLSLAFSPDGRWLASGQGGRHRQVAIIWDVQARRAHRVLRGHTKHIYALAFTPDSQRLVTGSDDHDLRLWRVADGGLMKVMRKHADKVRAVAVTPDNQIVSGGKDRRILRWDGLDGRFLGTLVEDQGTDPRSLSVSPDGQWLLAGVGSEGVGSDVHLYQLSDGERIHRYSEHDNIVLATAFSPDGVWAATAGGGDRSIHIWHAQTGIREYDKLLGQGEVIWSVGFSQQGDYLAWGKGFDKQHINHRGPLEYQIRLPDDQLPLGNPQSIEAVQSEAFIRARTQHDDWRLVGKEGDNATLVIQKNGETRHIIKRGSTNGYDHRAYTFTPGGRHIISGGMNGVLGYYTLEGRHLGDFVGHTGDIWAVAVSQDGRFLISGSGDQTVRLWRIDSQELLLTLLHGGDDWAAWTPQGYFTASPEGEDMLGWQVNRGPEKAADYVSGRQLRQHFYRPDIVDQAVRLGSAREAIEQSEDTAFSLEHLLAAAPPRFRVNETRFLPTAADPLLRIGLQVEPGTVQSYKVYLDGRYIQQVDATRSNHRIQHTKVLEVPVPRGVKQRQLRIEARDTQGILTTQSTQIDVPQSLFANQDDAKGDLYLLSIGVNEYPYLNRDLTYAKDDAAAFHRWLIQNHAADFHQVHEFLLHDDAERKPTRRQIRQALAQLAQAKPNDTVVVFLAGHAETQGKDYYFLSSNTEMSGETVAAETAVSWRTIQDSLSQARGQRILVADTCYAKGAFNPSLVNNASAAGVAVFSATDSADYVAEEKAELGHGVFTYSLLQGLQGQADSPRRPDNRITLAELKFFVKDEVVFQTQGRQRPAVYLSPQVEDYVIAKLDHAE